MANPTISVGNVVVGEKDGFARFAVRLSKPSTAPVLVDFVTADGTAANGFDFVGGSGILRFAPGVTLKTVRVPIVNDLAIESNESFFFDLSSPKNAVIANSFALATIIDNDAHPGRPVLAISDPVVDEKAGAAAFSITLDRPGTGTVTVHYTTRARSAGASDFGAVSGVVRFAPGETAKTVSVPIADDTRKEGNERLSLVLSGVTGARLPDPVGTATIWASDQAAVSRPAITVGGLVVGEKDAFAEFVVRLSAPSASPVSVDYSTANGGADNGFDYIGVSGRLDFAPGVTVETLRVPIIDDTLVESAEAFTLRLSAPAKATIATGKARATIIDDDSHFAILHYGLSNDTYVVTHANTVIIEAAKGGTDLVKSSVSFTLPDNVENLTLTGTKAINATGNARANVLTGNSAANTLNGGAGADKMAGGSGNDTYIVDNTGDAVTENPRQGTDTVRTTLKSYRLGANVEKLVFTGKGNFIGAGNALVNRLTGGAGNDTLNGRAGADRMVGGLGNDTYIVDNVRDVVTEKPGRGTDTVRTTLRRYTLGANVENLVFTGKGNFIGTGNTLANSITGGAGKDRLSAGAGKDLLNGGAGADRMAGGSGNDTYVVGNAGDVVTEKTGRGTDTVRTTLRRYTLGVNLENLVFTGKGNFTGAGNTLANRLSGGAGNDTLNGHAGADRMAGGAGNDSYFVDNVRDVVIEKPGQGTDTVRAALRRYTLGANVEKLLFTGKGNFTGTGNPLGNSITGGAGKDRLSGGAGNDTLNGRAGADKMAGGSGNDTYIVGNTGDLVTEKTGRGTDTVRTTLKSYRLGANLEKLVFTGKGNFTGTGNTLANRLSGGAGNDTLNGGRGADRMAGGAGNDTYIVENVHDLVTEKAKQGTDTVRTALRRYTLGANVEKLLFTGKGNFTGTGNPLGNSITGGAGKDVLSGGGGNDTLNGRAGADRMAGGSGNDTYIVGNTGDVVTEKTGRGTDTVRTTLRRYTLGANFENLVFTGKGNLIGIGNALGNSITGGAGKDRLSGGAGSDTLNGGAGADKMAGGSGNDTYIVGNAGDVVTEKTGRGTDTVRTTLKSYTLGANVENLVFTGKGNFTGIGNTLANSITGGAGKDVLSGGAGNDRLTGGAGKDRLRGGAGADLFVLTTTAKDTIADFKPGTDQIAFSDAGFNLGADDGKGTKAPQALAHSVFSSHSDGTMARRGNRFAYNAGSGALIYDPDGTGSHFRASQVASLLGDPHLSIADLFFIR